MGIVELLLTAIGLSMDAFAVSVCKGLGMRKMRYDQALVIGLYFGVFQALMPLLGWLLGTSFSRYIQAFDHWIAFVLLAFIGGKMLWDPDRKDNSSHIYEKRTHTQKHIRKIPAYEIPHNTNKIGCLGIAEKICS